MESATAKRFRISRTTTAIALLTTCFTVLFIIALTRHTKAADSLPPRLPLDRAARLARLHKRNKFYNPKLLAPGQVTVDQVVSLKEVPVPEPMAAVIVGPIPGPDTPLNFQPLTTSIVKDQAALIRLGKALFWDMQVGSDGVQACATCHFNGGADDRTKNQISPGLSDKNFKLGPIGGDNSFGESTVPYTANDPLTPNPPGPVEPPPANLNVPGHPGFKPNYTVQASDFPLNDWFNPTQLVPRGPGVTIFDEFANVSRDTNDIVGSQGVFHTKFVAVVPGSAVDSGTPLPDVFNTVTPGQLNLSGRKRRTEPRNAPTMINAVFNFDNLWDGKASFIFNGANTFGFRDRVSTPVMTINGVPTDVFVRITNSSLASVAAGVPTSNFTMSYEGRTMPDVGKKIVSLRPLAKQFVHPNDSALGAMSRAPAGLKGLNVPTYATMIKAAFQDQWWNSQALLTPVAVNAPQVPAGDLSHASAQILKGAVVSMQVPSILALNQYTQMEFNFALFFGLAVQAYEATLVADDTPFDRFEGAQNPVRENSGQPIPPDPTALTDQQAVGLTVFMDDDDNLGTHCADCHVPPVTTGHTVLDYQPDDQGVPSLTQGEAIEFMFMGDNGEEANYDHGMYNIGVRRTTEDKGRAGTAPFINPLTGKPFPFSLVELTALREQGLLPPDVARFVPDVPMLPRRVTNGAFKAPNLRDIRYSGPYFHVGDSATLRQVVEFYTRGGNFPNTNLADKTVDVDGIPPLMFPESNPTANAYIHALVDFLANGLTDKRVAFERAPFDHPQLIIPNGNHSVPAVGAKGRANKIPTFLNLNPQQP